MHTLALILAGLIGASLGLLGSGGSIVTLPVLVYVAGVPVSEAVVMSLIIVGATSMVGAAMSFRRGDVELPTTALFAVAGMVGALLGSPLTQLVAPAMLMLIFASLMLVIGGRMLWRGRKAPRDSTTASAEHIRPSDQPTGSTTVPTKLQSTTASRTSQRIRIALMGFAVGVLTGFLGVGAGFMIVPVLTLLGGMSVKKAMGSSLAIIALNSAAGLAGHAAELHGDWGLLAPFLVVALLGMLVSHQYAGRLSERALRLTFGWSVVTVGGVLLIVNLGTAVLNLSHAMH